jgi:hypothetical protein
MGQVKDEKLLRAIGLALKKCRESKSLTQVWVDFDTGIFTGRVELAKTNLSISSINELCKYYDTPLIEFFSKI